MHSVKNKVHVETCLWQTIKQNTKAYRRSLCSIGCQGYNLFNRQFLEMKLVSKLKTIDSNPWKLIIFGPRCFQVTRQFFNFWEPAFPGTWNPWFQPGKIGSNQFLELGTRGYKIFKAFVPAFRNRQFLGTVLISWKHAVPRLGRPVPTFEEWCS